GQSPYVLRPMDILHLRQFGKLFERFADGATLHLADRYVHPQERSRDEQEKQHEATSPYTSKIVERAEGDGKNEAAKPADHADETADRADVVRIVDGDVLVDGGLAESHEEAEHEHHDREWDDAHFHMEGNRAGDAAHHIVGRWIGQYEGADHRDLKSPVHHP